MESLYAAPTHMAGSQHTLPLYILELRFSAALAQSALQCMVRVAMCSYRSIVQCAVMRSALYCAVRCNAQFALYCAALPQGAFFSLAADAQRGQAASFLLELGSSAIGITPTFFSLVADAQRG